MKTALIVARKPRTGRKDTGPEPTIEFPPPLSSKDVQ